ncbi:hypothetical protein KSS87_009295 [Heliosperma pusillum]|nr:hypothetical protein KSS87_009295 [Heliosperma pusillum]
MRREKEHLNNMAVTPETLSRSLVSAAVSTDFSTSTTTQPPRNRLRKAASAVSRAFIGCLTPPDDDVDDGSYRKKQYEYHSYKSSYSGSTGKRNGSEKKRGSVRSYNPNMELDLGNLKLTMAQIYKATRDFSPSLKLGQGGFGAVYRGTLDDGTTVAIKRAKRIDYGNNLGAEFTNEIRTLAQVDHLCLVKLYGFLEDGVERILVVEYVPNGTLRDHLDGVRGDGLETSARLDIAIDVAHAITYLHMYTDKPIIHRDIKSSNILLTERCRAKVADFGFARIAPDRDSDATHVSTQVKGTAGYLDPVYLRTFHLTEKSDVYSFGALLVELVTGRRPIEPRRTSKERITTKWAIMKFMEGDTISTIDPKLEANSANVKILEKILELAFLCVAPQRENRPTMQRCVEILWSIRKDHREVPTSDTINSSPSSQRSTSFADPQSSSDRFL